MVSSRHQHSKGYQIFGMLAGLLFLLTPCIGAWSQGTGQQAEDTRPRSAAKGLSVVVQQGQLSVDLQEADLGEVLAQIGRLAGIRMVSGPSAGKRVNARFAGVELEEGLRRLLRLASLNHIFLYARGPAGSVAIAEVRVLGAGQDETPRQAIVTEPGLQEHEQNPGAPVRKVRGQGRTGTARSVGSGESDALQLVPEVVEPAQEPTPHPGQAEPSEATRHLIDMFKLSKQMGVRSPDGQAFSPHEPTQESNEQGGQAGFSR